MSESRLRILTANLLNGRARPDAIAEVVHSHRVDVAAFQELGPAQAAAIAAVLPHGKLEPALDHNGMGIALRRPGEVRRLPLPHRDARVAELAAADWGTRHAVEIVNLHVQAPHSVWPWVARARRRAQVSGVTRYLTASPRPSRVLVGDLNATAIWPAYRRLADHLPDAAVHHARRRGDRPRRTWGPWPGAPRLLRIDHVLASGLEPLHVETIGIAGSDHHAVLVELRVAAAGEEER